MALKNFDSQNIICSLCSYEREEIFILDCTHEFCRECLITFWGKRAKKRKSICCPLENCKKLVGNYIFEEILPKKSLKLIDKIECIECNQNIIPLKFSCKHKFCPKCGLKKAKKILKKNEEVHCFIENCNETLSESDLMNLGLSKKYLEKYFAKKDSNNKQKNKKEKKISQMTTDIDTYFLRQTEEILFSICKLCSQAFENLFVLDCKHSFCKNCLIICFKEMIQEKKPLKCPEISCFKEVNYYIIKQILPMEDFIKYDEYLAMVSLEGSLINEKKIQCPNLECNLVSLIWKNAEYFVCPQCNGKFCGNAECRGQWKLHENKTCEEFQKERDEIFEEKKNNEEIILEEKNTKICPACHTEQKRFKTCNLIRCESLICQKKKVFCFLCGEILKEGNIDKHFVENNLYQKCMKNVKSNHYAEIMNSSTNFKKNVPIHHKKKSLLDFFCCS